MDEERIKEYTITWKVIQTGQVRPHADSIYEFEIESTLYEPEIKRFCTNFLHTSNNECSGKPGEVFNGSTSFPHGLSSYYKFKKINENKYHYIVCQPYTG